MSWLPAICIAGSRYWLPLSLPAADLIAAVLLDQHASDQSLVAAIAQQLRCDPPLAIFVGLQTAVAGSAKPSSDRDSDGLSFHHLAQECLVRIPQWFAAGDALLGAPSHRDRFIPSWLELHRTFLTMPRSNWFRFVDQWLQVTGPAVRFPLGQPWLSLVDDQPMPDGGIDASHYAAPKIDLYLLARRMRREQSLSGAFGDALQDAKQAALKQFAYGLSHEINNPLANISARAQGLMREEADPHRKTSLQRIVDQSMRAHEMVADLMFFSHPPAPQLSLIQLDRLLTGVADQFGPLIADRGIELRVHCPVTSDCFQADRSMISEAVRALLRNSIEAIGCDGRVELAGSMHEGESGTATIVVRDSGPGLSDAARRHAFDPYFSGREAGRGLGVGLCRVQRIALLHGGGVSLASGPAGCTARLWIPAQS